MLEINDERDCTILLPAILLLLLDDVCDVGLGDEATIEHDDDEPEDTFWNGNLDENGELLCKC